MITLTAVSDLQLRQRRSELLATAWTSTKPAVTRRCAVAIEELNSEIRRRSAPTLRRHVKG
jgi:hypothetical protein